MNKRIKQLLKSLKELYLMEVVEKVALKTRFMKRKSKITPEIFLSLCLFGGEDLCRSSLLQLRSRLEARENITISPQALDQRFNKKSVEFLKSIFNEMFKKQNTILRDEEALLKSHFKAIKVVDSTTIILPEHLKTTYRGSGGSASDAAVKVQLQLDLLTGSFINCSKLGHTSLATGSDPWKKVENCHNDKMAVLFLCYNFVRILIHLRRLEVN